DRGAQCSQFHHWEYAVAHSPIARTSPLKRLQRLAPRLRALYLARPGLVAKLLAIVAFLTIGIV
ncbi:MAG: hypothetical protein ACREFV_11870, partial [Acetobacteraceae bacterium]